MKPLRAKYIGLTTAGAMALAFVPFGEAATLPVTSLNLIANDPEATVTLDAEEVAGVVPRSNWNNIQADGTNYGAFTFENLVDDSGQTTDATYAYDSTGGGGNFNTVGPTDTPDERMMASYQGTYEGGEESFFTISGLSGPYVELGYEVYVYWGGADAQFADEGDEMLLRSTIEVDGDPIGDPYYMGYIAFDHWDGDFAQTPVTSQTEFMDEGAWGEYNYAHFTGLNAESFTIRAEAPMDRRVGISGIQVVAIPEPASLALMGLGGLLLVARRRR